MTPATSGNALPEPSVACSLQPVAASAGANASVANGQEFRRPNGYARAVTRCGALLILCGVLLSVLGCGNSFTGGSVPIGRAQLFGRVVNAENPQTAIANATITVVATPSSGASTTLQTTTDTNGAFDFPAVPTSIVSGNVVVTVNPAEASLRSQQLSFLVRNGNAADLIVTLPDTSFDVSGGASVRIFPPTLAANTQQTVSFKALVLNKNGQALPVLPTLLFDGNAGTLNSDGTFSSTGAGTGTILAFWNNGSIDLVSNAVQVTVTLDKSKNPLPAPNVPTP